MRSDNKITPHFLYLKARAILLYARQVPMTYHLYFGVILFQTFQ